MPHHKSTKKRLLTDARKRLQNRSSKSRVRTLEKKFREAVAAGDKENATVQYKVVQQALDQAASNNILKKQTVARKKSRLVKLLNPASAS